MIDGKRERLRAAKAGQVHAPEDATPRGIGAWLAKRGVTADAITVLGIVLASLTGIMIGAGWFYEAAGMLIVGGLMDTLDGMVAKAAGTSSPRGAFFDSVGDRVADGMIFGGLAFHFIDGHSPKLALLPIAILAIGALVSYERAKAESLGFTARGGLMERAERLILLGLSLVVQVATVEILIVLLVLTCGTAIGRFVRIWNQATTDHPNAATRRPVSSLRDPRKPGADARWRNWRNSESIRARRGRREIVPLTTRLRGVLAAERMGTSAERKRRDRPARPHRSVHSND